MLRCLLELYSVIYDAVLFVTETKRMTTKMTRYPEASLSEQSVHFKEVYILTCASCLLGGGRGRHGGGGGRPRGSIGASAGHLRPGQEGEDHSYPRGKRLLHLQQHKPVRKTLRG